MHPNVARVVAAAHDAGLEIEVERFPEGTRTAVDTPTDLTTYTDHLATQAAQAVARAVAAQASEAAAPQMAASSAQAPAQMSFASSLTVNRRAPIEISRPLVAGAGSGDHAMELDSPLDVPAFLRRQN